MHLILKPPKVVNKPKSPTLVILIMWIWSRERLSQAKKTKKGQGFRLMRGGEEGKEVEVHVGSFIKCGECIQLKESLECYGSLMYTITPTSTIGSLKKLELLKLSTPPLSHLKQNYTHGRSTSFIIYYYLLPQELSFKSSQPSLGY